MIQNFYSLNTSKTAKTVLDCIEIGLKTAEPTDAIKNIVSKKTICMKNKKINLKKYHNIHTIAFGKAADSMTKAVDSILCIKSGIFVIPTGTKPLIKDKKFQICYGTHPIPSTRSLNSAKKVIKFLENIEPNDFVLFLVSGGGSSLLAYPNGISIKEKSHLTNLLLKSGANIQQINCVRKHLSKIKGGRLLEHLFCDGCALIMSDVQGDDMSSISSGCTYFDKTRYSDALRVIKKYNLQNKISKNIITTLNLGINGRIPETPKKETIPNQVILSNSICLDAMSNFLIRKGYSVKKVKIFGDIDKAVTLLKRNIPKSKKTALVFGGEITVNVTGDGKGGRNQELVLRSLYEKIFLKDHVIASVGTDGIDGNTKYAGAISEYRNNFSEMKNYLSRNDSNSFFRKYGGLVKTGPTHTNVMDIGIILKQ